MIKRYIQAAIRGPYWFLHPKRKFGIVRVGQDCWEISHKGKKLYMPFDVLPTLEYEHDYEKYYTVKSDDVVIDAGAGYGDFSWAVADRCKQLISLEPDLTCFRYLQKNLRHWDNTLLLKMGLSNKKGTVVLDGCTIVDAKGPSGNNLTSGKKEKIKVTTLDEITNEYDCIGFIKMDIEGAEIKALKGAGKTLKKTKHVTIATYHIVGGTTTTSEVTRILKDYGFYVHSEGYPWTITYGHRIE